MKKQTKKPKAEAKPAEKSELFQPRLRIQQLCEDLGLDIKSGLQFGWLCGFKSPDTWSKYWKGDISQWTFAAMLKICLGLGIDPTKATLADFVDFGIPHTSNPNILMSPQTRKQLESGGEWPRERSGRPPKRAKLGS